MSLEGSLPETSGQEGQSVEESLQQREMLAVVVVTGHLCQGWQERGHLLSHPLYNKYTHVCIYIIFFIMSFLVESLMLVKSPIIHAIRLLKSGS